MARLSRNRSKNQPVAASLQRLKNYIFTNDRRRAVGVDDESDVYAFGVVGRQWGLMDDGCRSDHRAAELRGSRVSNRITSQISNALFW